MTLTKKILLFFLVFIILFGSAELVFGRPRIGRDLEIEYPEIAGEQPEKVTTPVPEYVRYIYNGLIWLSGLIALIVLIIGGFEWFTSAGNIDRIRSAKDRISAAVLGIIILIGSYLILISINPELVVFHLPRLRPIISELTPGVLLCKERVDAEKAWDLTIEYKFQNPSEDREKEIKKELDIIFDKIALNCYTIAGSGDIGPDFDNKIADIYFIPNIKIGKDGMPESATEYGAIIYEQRGFEGTSMTMGEHLFSPEGEAKTYQEQPPFEVSSIKPFVLIYEPDKNWEVTLYQEYDENRGVSGAELISHNIESYSPGCQMWWCSFSLPSWSPKSIRVEGDLLAVLTTPDGRSDTFSSGVDNNLEDNLNIVKQVTCTDYKNQTIIKQDCILVGGFGQNLSYMPCCGEAAATKLIIISASLY